MGKREMIDAISRTVMRWQDATQAYDEAVGEIAGLNAAERRCLSFLHEGPQPAGAIAAATGLTPAAITSLVDRLGQRGFLVRERSAEDRRKVMVDQGPAARSLSRRFYEPLGREGADLLGRYSDEELAAVLRFLGDAVTLQERQLAALKEAAVEAMD